MVSTADFPQADNLLRVGEVADAVQQKNHTYLDIEKFLGMNSSGRQGRYYRLSAEILGLVSNDKNHARLTDVGASYLKLVTEQEKLDFLAPIIVQLPSFYEGLNYIKANAPTRSKLKDWYFTSYPAAPTTAERRFSSFLSYVTKTGIVRVVNDRFEIVKNKGVKVEVKPVEEGITGKVSDTLKKEMETAETQKTLQVIIDLQKRERANLIHWNLVAAKEAFLKERKLLPQSNAMIDLFTQKGDDVIVYEMKSVTGKNFVSQIRKAVSQLYEYRYFNKAPTARMCIVTDGPITKTNQKMIEYLTKDRNIAYVWTDDFETFQCDLESAQILGDFAP